MLSRVLELLVNIDQFPKKWNPQRLLRIRAALKPPFQFAWCLLGEFV
jgi:hypothetical protein